MKQQCIAAGLDQYNGRNKPVLKMLAKLSALPIIKNIDHSVHHWTCSNVIISDFLNLVLNICLNKTK